MYRILLLALAASALSLLSAPTLTQEAIREIALRNIPGTFTSGRIADVTADPKNRDIRNVSPEVFARVF